jgi:hypothetical protein
MVEHLVLFKLKDDTTALQKNNIVETLRGLAVIAGVAEISVGLNHSQEGKSKGFEVGMRICFPDQEALDAYLPSDLHKSIVGKVNHHFADVIVLDYTR